MSETIQFGVLKTCALGMSAPVIKCADSYCENRAQTRVTINVNGNMMNLDVCGRHADDFKPKRVYNPHSAEVHSDDDARTVLRLFASQGQRTLIGIRSEGMPHGLEVALSDSTLRAVYDILGEILAERED